MVASRHTRSNGRISPRSRAAIAGRPAGDAPASARMSTVSAWSSAVWPSAITAAPTLEASARSAPWRATRARSCIDPPAATSTESARNVRPRAAARRSTSPASSADPARIPWSTCATDRRHARGGANRASASSRAVESGPPLQAISTCSPGAMIPRRSAAVATARRTRATAAVRSRGVSVPPWPGVVAVPGFEPGTYRV